MNSLFEAANARMNRVKRAMGLPESISLFGLVRMCPILVFFTLVIVGALLVMALG